MENNLNTNQPQTTEKIPHSGNLPGELRETPMRHFDTPLADAPVNPLDINDFTATETLTATPEKKSRKKVVLASIAGLALAGGAAFGFNAINSTEKETEPPVADPKGTTEVEEVPSPEVDTSFLEKTYELSTEDYLKLSQKDRLAYSLDGIRVFDLSNKVEEASWTKPSLDNSAQQIYENFWYALNTATAQSTPNFETGEATYNATEAEKLLSGVFDNTFNADPDPGFLSYPDRRDFIAGLDKPYVNTKPVTVEEYSPNTPMTKNGEELVYRDILVHEADHESAIVRFIYREFTDANGEPASLWLQESTRKITSTIPE